MNMMALMYVGIGGAFGSICRYLVVTGMLRFTNGDYPFGTFAVNVIGGFLLGAWIAVMATMMPGRAKDLHLLFAVGALGGFTTFSAFSLDVFMLLERGLVIQAILYILSSVLLSVAAVVGGMWSVRYFAE